MILLRSLFMRNSITKRIVAIVFFISSSFSMLITIWASEKLFDEAFNTYTNAINFSRENILINSYLLG